MMPRSAQARVGATTTLISVVVFTALACAEGRVDAVTAMCLGASVVYGEDGRHDLSPDDPLRALGEASVLAVLTRERAEALAAGRVQPTELAAGRLLTLCPEEPFAQQPSLAHCTGVLLAPDLVLTAGHCLRYGDACDDYVYATRFIADDDGNFDGFSPDQLHECAQVLWLRHEADPARRRHDYALVQLARSVDIDEAHLPRPRLTPVVLDEAVVLLGHPAGLPLKIDRGARVVNTDANAGRWFGADLDNFSGGSGAPVLDAHGALLGIAVEGLSDWIYDAERDCQRSHVLDGGDLAIDTDTDTDIDIDIDASRFERVAGVRDVLEDACTARVEPACRLLADEAAHACR